MTLDHSKLINRVAQNQKFYILCCWFLCHLAHDKETNASNVLGKPTTNSILTKLLNYLWQIESVGNSHLKNNSDNSCGSTRPFSHGKVRLYPWEVCVLCVTSIPTVKLPLGNHYGYIKKNKRITHDVSQSKS